MSNSSILGGTPAPRQAEGKDVDLLGPSDTSDSGSDVQGERPMSTAPDNPGEWGAVVSDMSSDTDSAGTGDRASADGDPPRDGADILPDRIIRNIVDDDGPADDGRESSEVGDLSIDPEDADEEGA